MKRTLCLMIIFALLFTLGVVAMAEEEKTWAPDVEFTTVDTAGEEWTDRVFADAHLTLVNLWAYWCPPCVGELPDLQKLSEDYADQGLLVLGVSPAQFEDENIKTMEELKIQYPTLRLTESLNLKMNTGYVPATIFVDSDGHIVGDIYVGSRSYEDWAEIIDDYLAEHPYTTPDSPSK